MSAYLDNMRMDFETRMSAHEGMLAHLGLNHTEENALLVLDEMTATMVACGSCHCPKTCLEWQASEQAGPPPWCHRRGSFLTLVDACIAADAESASCSPAA